MSSSRTFVGVLDKLGYGWNVLEPAHPRLIMASVSGLVRRRSLSPQGAYDLVVQAMSGMMSITGHPGTPPTRPGTSIGDLAASVFAANGVRAALLQRYRTGKGGRVDIAMLDCQIALLEECDLPLCGHRHFSRSSGRPPLPGRRRSMRSGQRRLPRHHRGSDTLFARLAEAYWDSLDCPPTRASPRAASRWSTTRYSSPSSKTAALGYGCAMAESSIAPVFLQVPSTISQR
jgi:CoA:oxalate CoA-transferase